MKLRILVAQGSVASEQKKFRLLTHHITEIFMALLPKIEINGSSKILLEFGPRGNEDLFDNVLNATNLFIENFDFTQFYSLNHIDQDKLILKELNNSLILITQRIQNCKENVDIINLTTKKVLDNDFNLSILIKKLCKNTTDRKYKIDIYRVLNAHVGESWYCEVTNKITSEVQKNG